MHKTIAILVAGFAMGAAASPAAAEVTGADDNGFVTRAEAIVEANTTETWLALISPARWWSSEHTWSADAANLTLTPQAGGCFCEKIPEVNEPDRFTLEGSVEHMRVIQAYPEVALRMSGALGPLQSEPVTGILTIALSQTEEGTRIVWEYNVGGSMRYPIPVISNAVDGVMTLQLTRLSELLGQVKGPAEFITIPEPEPEPEPAPAPEGAEEDFILEEGSEQVPAQEAGQGAEGEEPAVIEPEAVIEEETPSGPSVDEAFEDLGDPPAA